MWQPKAKEPLTYAEAEEIVENVTGYVRILLKCTHETAPEERTTSEKGTGSILELFQRVPVALDERQLLLPRPAFELGFAPQRR